MKTLFCLVFLLLPFIARAQAAANWNKALENFDLDASNHCFCYLGEDQEVVSSCNQDKLWSIASLTKLITSHWLIHKLSPNYHFQTKFHLNKDKTKLHIEGGQDPVFTQDTIVLLLISLKRMGVHKLNEVSFDQNFALSPEHYKEKENQALVHDLDFVYRYNKNKLVSIFNTSYWPSGFYTSFKRENSELENLPSSLSFSVKKIIYKELDFESQITLEYKSAPLVSILDYMNRFSINGIADYFFTIYGKEDYHHFLEQNYGWVNSAIYNGSGLPYYQNSVRFENQTSCPQILDTLEGLTQDLEGNQLSLYDILPTVSLEGTLENRFAESPYDFSYSLWAKTGTINNVSALAGRLLSQKKDLQFVMLGRGHVRTMKEFEEYWVELLSESFQGPAYLGIIKKDFQRFDQNIPIPN